MPNSYRRYTQSISSSLDCEAPHHLALRQQPFESHEADCCDIGKRCRAISNSPGSAVPITCGESQHGVPAGRSDLGIRCLAARSWKAPSPFGMPLQAHADRPKLQGRRHWSGISILSKRSLRSFTSDFEADDERSSTDGSMSSRSSDGDLLPIGAPYYSGHDARPTSRKELLGWYMYGFAAEVYVVCGIGKSGTWLRNGIACSKSAQEQHPELAGCDGCKWQTPVMLTLLARQAHSFLFSWKLWPGKTAYWFQTIRSHADRVTAKAATTGSASSTFWVSKSTPPVLPCTPFQSVSYCRRSWS